MEKRHELTIQFLNDPANVGWNMLLLDAFGPYFFSYNAGKKTLRVAGSASAKDGPEWGDGNVALPQLDDI